MEIDFAAAYGNAKYREEAANFSQTPWRLVGLKAFVLGMFMVPLMLVQIWQSADGPLLYVTVVTCISLIYAGYLMAADWSVSIMYMSADSSGIFLACSAYPELNSPKVIIERNIDWSHIKFESVDAGGEYDIHVKMSISDPILGSQRIFFWGPPFLTMQDANSFVKKWFNLRQAKSNGAVDPDFNSDL